MFTKTLFSKIEKKVLLFLFVSFLAGIILKVTIFNNPASMVKKFDYSKEDSLFFEESSANTLNSAEKIVGSEQELLDFSKDKINYKAKSESALKSYKIDVNSAKKADLEKLPGIGPKTADAIIIYRNKNGSFKSIDDLVKVKGIGIKKLEKIKNNIFIK